MRLTISLATRGRPELLKRTVEYTLRNMQLDSTTLLIATDEDDQPTLDSLKLLPKDLRLKVSCRPREDSRGEKYDRALTDAPADVYLLAVDYAPILTPAFDAKILKAASLWPDGIGVVYTEMVDELVPYLQAPTARFVELLGYTYSPEYPYWFVDHEVADIAWMIGRVNMTNIRCDVSKRPEKTMRMRDLSFWAAYYDLMALERRNKARSIIRHPDFQAPNWLKEQLCNWYPLIEMRSRGRNARVRAGADSC